MLSKCLQCNRGSVKDSGHYFFCCYTQSSKFPNRKDHLALNEPTTIANERAGFLEDGKQLGNGESPLESSSDFR